MRGETEIDNRTERSESPCKTSLLMECGKSKHLTASTTVEAALILPLMLAVIFAFFRLMFFMYARIKLDADLDRSAIEAARYISENGEKDPGTELRLFADKYIQGYPYYTVNSRMIDSERNRIKTTATLKSMINMGFSGVFVGSTGEIKSSTTVDGWDCPRIKRLIDIAMQMKQDQ